MQINTDFQSTFDKDTPVVQLFQERAGIVHRDVEVPVENGKIDAEVVSRGQLLLDRAYRIVLPCGARLAILIRKVKVGQGTRPAGQIIRTEASAGLP